MKTTTFIQPRHTYAPDEGFGHIYMPTAILMATARVLYAGGNITFQDENLRPAHIDNDVEIVGMHTVGPSLMPSTLNLQAKISATRPDIQFLQGGQIIDGLDLRPIECLPTTGKNFRRIFGERAVNGNSITTLAQKLEIDARHIPNTEKTSLVPAYEMIDDQTMQMYLSNPFSLYVSQGCKFACNFCAARRSHNNTIGEKVEIVSEQYRDIAIIEQDVQYLVERARMLGVNQLTMYMSNLDLTQTPEKIREFAEMMHNIRLQNPDVPIKLTGLSTVTQYKKLVESNPTTLTRLHEAGLVNIGFGIEGMAKDYWRKLKKGQNKADDCYNMIADAVERGFVPEILLTPGHAADTEETLQTTVEYATYMKELYGPQTIIRPYCAKVWTTGNDGWHSQQYADKVETVLSTPELFQSLEFNAEQTWFTAANSMLLNQVNWAYRKLVELSDGAAPDLRAITPGMSDEEKAFVRTHNMGKYDH